ncbi:MAG TPA: extracellular solute-binding protein [Methylomirabilota bacterium]|nr:extracellular solute-binding protein [Methylomirabilota bacterium]
MKTHRGYVLFVTAVALLTLLAVGFRGDDASSAAPRAAFPTAKVTLRIWDTTEKTKAALYQEVLVPSYMKRRPNVTVDYQSVSTADLQQKLLAALTAGTGPDVFTLADWFLPTYFDKNLLDPVPPDAFGAKSSQDLLERYIPGLLGAQVHNGALYAIPIQMNAFSLFLNNRLFKEARLDPQKDAPRSWEDVARLSKALTKRQGERVVQKGFEMRYAGDHWLAFMFHTLVYQAGGDVLKDGKPVFNNDAGVRALTIWKDVTVAPKVSQNTGASPYHDFAVEQDAMTFAGPNGGAVVEAINPKMKGNYTVVPLPQIDPGKPRTMMYSFNLVVNAKASPEVKTVAWDFIQSATSQPTLWMQRTRMVQPVKGWFDTAEAKQVPYLDIFIRDLSIGRPMARSQNFNELQAAIARAVDRVVLQGADPRRSLDQAAEEFNRARATR